MQGEENLTKNTKWGCALTGLSHFKVSRWHLISFKQKQAIFSPFLKLDFNKWRGGCEKQEQTHEGQTVCLSFQCIYHRQWVTGRGWYRWRRRVGIWREYTCHFDRGALSFQSWMLCSDTCVTSEREQPNTTARGARCNAKKKKKWGHIFQHHCPTVYRQACTNTPTQRHTERASGAHIDCMYVFQLEQTERFNSFSCMGKKKQKGNEALFAIMMRVGESKECLMTCSRDFPWLQS